MADPEALLLVSCIFARWDSRLFDEVVNWTIDNANFINFPRLKSLLRKRTGKAEALMSAVADTVVSHNKRLNWKLDAMLPSGEPLFLSPTTGGPVPCFGPRDALFERRGWLRGPFVRRDLSRLFNPLTPPTAILRLRSLIGISARAEILAYLSTHESAHPSQVARCTGYSQKNVQDALVDMTASGMVDALPADGRRIVYRLTNPRGLREVLIGGAADVTWVNWIAVFSVLEAVWDELTALDPQSPELVIATRLRELRQRIEPDLQAAGILTVIAPLRDYEGLATLLRVQEDLSRLMNLLETS